MGATGAGKTTIARLMARFYDPTSGRVTLDGVDLRDLSDEELRRAVVMVTQDNFLFSGTVADNIGFGRPDASRAEIEDAAKAIGAHDFISALPDGYDTDIQKRGGRLSAGQRQLVAFARAFLAQPAVLILDEATSSLDIPSERLVQSALRTLLARPHRGDHRPPVEHGRDRRPRARPRRRPHRRGRLPRRPRRRRRPLPRPPPGLARQPGVAHDHPTGVNNRRYMSVADAGSIMRGTEAGRLRAMWAPMSARTNWPVTADA